MPGTIQTDKLENRFGKYIQLAGSQHHVSVCQIYETETKLRMQSSLSKIFSTIHGNIPIDLEIEDQTLDTLFARHKYIFGFKNEQ